MIYQIGSNRLLSGESQITGWSVAETAGITFSNARLYSIYNSGGVASDIPVSGVSSNRSGDGIYDMKNADINDMLICGDGGITFSNARLYSIYNSGGVASDIPVSGVSSNRSGDGIYDMKNADINDMLICGDGGITFSNARLRIGTPGDLNGDFRADIVMSITQEGHAAFGTAGAWLIGEDQTAEWSTLNPLDAGWEVFGTGVAAFIGIPYGGPFVVTENVYLKSSDNEIGAWMTDNEGQRWWKTIASFDSSTDILGLGDFDGNGQTDLLLRNDNGAVGCFLTGGGFGRGAESSETGWNYFQSLGDEWTIAAVGDLNSDGISDLVLKHDAGLVGCWLTQKDHSVTWMELDTLQDDFSIVGCGDFNGDGTDDILLKNGNYYGAWLMGGGEIRGWMGLGDLGDVAVEQIRDFDCDGKDDLRIRTAAGDLGVQLVKGADTLEWKYYGSVGSEWNTALAALG